MSNENFETDNLFLAAFLHAKGQKIEGTRLNGSRMVIMFSESGANDLKFTYLNGGLIEATRFVESYVTLKRMIQQENKR